MANSYGEILTARGGSYILNDTSLYTGRVYAIAVLQDTIFDTLESIDTNDVIYNVLADQIAAPLVAVKAGALLTPLDINKPFYNIQLTSGSVTLVLK
jgi:hypothetical protein